MEGIAAVQARVAAIQGTMAQLAPARVAAPATAATSTSAPAATGADFAAALTQAVDATALPTVDGFTPEQVANAAAVVEAGRGMGLSLRDQAIGVMTAIGESSLRVVDHGDAAGPDSRGLFQQRDNGAWGTYADRMDPTRSAQSFYRVLATVDGRDRMEPTIVAHTVQRNADPQHYARSWDAAVRLVARITGSTPAQVTAAR
ncbi:hypothetical protein [Cellulomonas oligotrophica]|uniref:Uncharacterized protein n=1 Tax=Cellulomonas oligotrophica TaxID=931536 RepID=A0A7Y9FKB2_9CELL|nr:hypothetical protein [Cellulomonas oligotrophica]NYD87631.1 hypothetical protein [Cellulomonas oligotrophica]GIG33508.1 hypothetical protein Col01nite_26670 [Cellulomonas oligotrophica]